MKEIIYAGFGLWMALLSAAESLAGDPISLGSRRELFIDMFLIDFLDGCEIQFHHPVPALVDLPNCPRDYQTILKDGDLYRLYYRSIVPGYQGDQKDGHAGEITCYAQSTDGVHWTTPSLGLFEINGSRDNNVIWADGPPLSHNFTPFIDDNPAAVSDRRFKAVAGIHETGLFALTSPDGVHWKKIQDSPIITSRDFAFDSQNVAFWSPTEKCYLCYFRTWKTPYGELRTFSRTTSTDFLHWTTPVPIQPNLPGEHLYTSGTHPYYRAPHILIALPSRFMPKRGESTDILLMSSRDGLIFDRLFKEAYIWPGLDPGRWGNRANYAAWHVVPTGPAEMSIYLKNLRFSLRIDGFASIYAGYRDGRMLTKPFTFTGKTLSINFATSAAGGVRVELQDEFGKPISGFSCDECPEIIGDEIDHTVKWNTGSEITALAGRPVRMLFMLKEANLYSLKFEP
jgi:hypothetical protein